MPTYKFYDPKSGIEWDQFLTMAEREKFLEENEHIQQVPVMSALSGDHLMGVGPKNDNAFNDVMKNIASKHPDSPMADKYGSGKSTKRLQAENVYKKHKARK